MRFLVDECTGPAVARWLVDKGHEVVSVFEEARGTSDDEILKRAVNERRILITNDKDFGEKVYRDKYRHCGVILLRLIDERSQNKIKVLTELLDKFREELSDEFVVATETHVRFGQSQ